MFIIAGLVLALGACKKDKVGQALSEMEGWKDKMCACKDKACADDVEKNFRDWRKEMKSNFSKEEAKAVPAEQQKKLVDLTMAMDECRMKVSGDATGAAPAPAGDTGAPAPAPAPTPAPAGSANP